MEMVNEMTYMTSASQIRSLKINSLLSEMTYMTSVSQIRSSKINSQLSERNSGGEVQRS